MATQERTSGEQGLSFDVESGAWTVRALKPVDYEVRVTDGVFDPGNRALADTGTGPGGRRFVVVDKIVDTFYGERLRAYFEYHDIECHVHVIEAHEGVKGMDTATDIVRALDAFGIDRRREPVIAVGGGVLTDIVCLTANLYRRGTPVVRVPTTLIGLVDAGVGVKTGVNFNGGKNRLGTYYASTLTLLDRSFIATLDRRHIANGLAEILKIALVKDERLFTLLEEHGRDLLAHKLQGRPDGRGAVAVEVVHRAIQGMLEELHDNLWETTLERVVDYGHTFSPTIEMRALPALLHGEAVCVDMALTTVVAWRRGLVSTEERDRVLGVMRVLELPAHDTLLERDPGLLGRALDDTTRHRDGLQRLPLPVGIGGVTFVNDVSHDELASAVEDLRLLNAPEGAAHA
ncbi:sedoheptulose 7-phosphate cyclase [Nocardiopsis sp. FIRDI 009]|uniref:sedoheptulose 7-phosphate cyclase n=1 Tax=Nocardiopsis sp. FIRDI 009 TaxID=714197 RepID=UPI000E278077|nr:sedoheptulose 7-phosphate cyclase [Nocardiopsis sp. FIRDI 009]